MNQSLAEMRASFKEKEENEQLDQQLISLVNRFVWYPDKHTPLSRRCSADHRDKLIVAMTEILGQAYS